MPRNIRVEGDMTAIGEVRTPPFARLPDPVRLFERRAARFRQLEQPEGIGPYLGFLGSIAELQARLAGNTPDLPVLDAARLERARANAMPPLDRNAYRPDAAFSDFSKALFDGLDEVSMPASAREALGRVRSFSADRMALAVADLMGDAVPVETMAEHAYVAAALQLRFTAAAAALPEKQLVPVADGACPSCGGPPVSSVIVGWPQAGGTRYCACALCATLWHHVRIKCTICASTKGIRYQEIEDGPGSIKAETCDECGCYVKIMNQQKDASLDPFADDVGSLGIDLLMRDTNFRRGAFNPFLLGY